MKAEFIIKELQKHPDAKVNMVYFSEYSDFVKDCFYDSEEDEIVITNQPLCDDVIRCNHCGNISSLTGLIGETTDNCPVCGKKCL